MNSTDSATQLAELIVSLKQRILDDIEVGIVPTSVDTFDELHTYIDLNRHPGLLDAELASGQPDSDTLADRNARVTYVRDMLDSWLQTSRADTMPCEVCGADLVTSQHTRRAFSGQRPEGTLVCSIACRDEHHRVLAEDLT